MAKLDLESSPVLDLMDVPSSLPKYSMPEVHGLVGSAVLESTGTLLSGPTQPILEVIFTNPSKDNLSHRHNLQPPHAQGMHML